MIILHSIFHYCHILSFSKGPSQCVCVAKIRSTRSPCSVLLEATKYKEAPNLDIVSSGHDRVGQLGVATGRLDRSKWSQRQFHSFQGIPFAEPPIGSLRFAPPVKVISWKDYYLDAKNFRSICPQTKQPGYDVEGYDEDCLHLNVYVPATNGKELLPVMIWIHGGSFMSGHAQRFKPHYLMESDIILVVPQFRLGPLGLLCLGTEEIPGNVQFLDQVMAMEWVRDNIESFGGDRNRVTLSGQSSGAYSVNLHLLSPLSQGLFHRTIIQSNSVYTPGMIDRNPVKTAKEIAAVLKCNVESVERITECMKNLSAKSILEGFDKYLTVNSVNGGGSWGGNRAVIQRTGSVRFLTEEPSLLIEQGKYLKVPMIGGTTSQDGSLLASGLYDGLSSIGLLNDPNFLKDKLIPLSLKYIGVPDETGVFSQILIEKYFSSSELGDFLKMVPGLIDIGSVLIFKAGMYRMVHENSRFQPTFMYSFDYRGSQTRFGYESVKKYPFDGGVAHSDDYIYLFPFPDNLTEADTVIAKRIVQLWTSFTINGTPSADFVSEWPKMSTRAGPYLKIGTETRVGDNYFYEYTVTIHNKATSLAASLVHCLC
ncbi:juvenile hormone esterase-like isoform X2 [Neodiprion virginianus]|uniref:juvenile hormone esterase-like isoform X2 n=1 Tax=Neodiprion virginianus TaxID=2961670 RepID=UPI001EE6B211|nr:juvenile hormone esterase-like isoform X2 [Neodiprion virginianus]